METPVIRVAGALLAAGLSWLSITALPGWEGARSSAIRAEETRKMVSAARAHIASGNFELALHPALELNKLFPGSHIYLEQLATIYGALHRYQQEAETWEQYLRVSPVPVEGCPQVGVAWRNQGASGKALDALNRCLEYEAGNPDVLYQLGYTLERADPARAAEIFERGLHYAPDDPDLVLGLGRVELREGKAAEALRAARSVLERLPDNTDALLLGGLALVRLDHAEEAAAMLRHGAEVSPKYADIHLALATLAERRKDPEEAASRYQRVLELDPENGEASIRLAAVRSGRR